VIDKKDNNTNTAATITTTTTTPPPSSCCPSNQYTANAGPDQTVLEGTMITLNGSGNNNNKSSNVGNTANYLWRQTNGPAIILNGNNTAHPTFIAPNYPNDTKYTFALEVFENQVNNNNNNNNQTGSAVDTVDIIVKDANIEAKNPGFLQEDDNTGKQSDQNGLEDDDDDEEAGGEEEQSDDNNNNNEEKGNADE
jgi:chitinase